MRTGVRAAYRALAVPGSEERTMALTQDQSVTTGADAAAVAELQEIVERQRAAFLDDPYPSLEHRQELLQALAGMVMGHRMQIREAMSADFGVHPTQATDLIEVLGVAGRAAYAAERIETWMAAEPREVDPAMFGSARAFVQPQPKGVVGNIVPWNFPFDLSVGPLVEMLAAGNRVVIKPSEYTPACAELLRDMVRATFARRAAERVRDAMPDYCTSGSCTGIITTRHLERIEALLEDARARGCDIRTFQEAGEGDPAARQLPLSLVLDPPDDLGLMKEEIFGPILPIKAYDDLDQAIEHVNAGERPLALYVFAQDETVADDVLRRTTSGGACINSAAVHGALPSLPFGGTGQSGSGRHHGVEGFREFSNLRAVFVRGQGDLIDAFAPPYGAAAQAVVDGAFGA